MNNKSNEKIKEIGILEYHYHSIYFYTLAKVCNTVKTHVTLFTTQEIYSLIEGHLENKDQYTIIIKDESESIGSFLKKVESTCSEKIDLLFVNTIQESLKDLPHYFNFKPNCKMILTVHDANTWMNHKLTFEIKRPFRTLDSLISALIIQKIVLPRFMGINVVYPPIKDYIINNNFYKKDVFTFPFILFDDNKKLYFSKDKKKIKFVVPGAVIEQRRDHEVVIDAFENLFKKYKERISLCLLGKSTGVYGKRILNRCKKLKDKGFDISYFKSYVPEEIYDRTLNESTVVIAPIKLHTTSLGTWKETFGLSKASGAIFDAIQYAKPFVLPEKFKLMDELKNSSIKYSNSNDLESKLAEIIEDGEKLISLGENAIKNSKKLSFSIYKKYFENNLLNRI